MTTTITTRTITTGFLTVPDARLYYELRGGGPLIVLVGAPMDADAFAPLADLLATDHTVLTTDPRGIKRSTVDDRDRDSTPAMRADDLSRLLRHVDAGPATVLGSSGGAVSALALMQTHPDQVHALVAHEPPLEELLPDRDQLRADTEDYVATYLTGDVVGAWSKFFARANIDLPDGAVEQMFGGERDTQVIADEYFWFARELRASTQWEPDLQALRAVAARIVIGVGADSAGQACDETSQALATALGVPTTAFPGGHIGFTEDPHRFAARLRTVLGDR